LDATEGVPPSLRLARASLHPDSETNADMDSVTYTLTFPNPNPVAYFPVAFPDALVHGYTISFVNAYGLTDAYGNPYRDSYPDSYFGPESNA
jgi:hypothetical protein